MKRLHTWTAVAITGIVGFSAISAPIAAQASEEGKRNTAIGLGAVAAALLLTQKNKTPGLIAAGGALLAASQLGRDRRDCDDDRRFNDHRFDRDNRFDRDHHDDHDRRDNDRFHRDNGYRFDEHGGRHTGFGR